MKAAVMGDDKIMPLILMNVAVVIRGGSVAEWLACWTQVQKGSESQSRCCRVTVLGKLFTPVLPLFTKQRNW